MLEYPLCEKRTTVRKLCANILCKGLTFTVKPALTEYSGFLLPFALLLSDVKTRWFM